MDGLVEREAFVAGYDLEWIPGHDFMSEFPFEAIEDLGVGRDIQAQEPGSRLELDTKQDRSEMETGFPVAGDVGAIAMGSAVYDAVDALFGEIAVFVAVCGPRPISEAVAQDRAGAMFASAVVEDAVFDGKVESVRGHGGMASDR